MTAAMQLHRDACLMNTNLDILDQYVLALHGMAFKILQLEVAHTQEQSSSRSAGPTSTSSFGPHGGIGSLGALDGPNAVRHAILQDQHPGRLKRIIMTFGDISVFCKV